MNLPVFPASKKMNVSDGKTVEIFTHKFPPYSDFNFLSLFSYNTEEDLTLSTLNGNLIINMRDYVTNEKIFTMLGVQQVKDTIERIFSHQKYRKEKPVLKLVPEITALQVEDGHDFIIREDRDNFDYIYSVSSLVYMKGSSMHKLKNYVNRFRHHFPHIEVKKVDLNDYLIQTEIMSVFDAWKKFKGQDKEAEHERIAIVRTIKNAAKIGNIYAIALFDGKKMVAFMISDLGNDKFSQSHFAKAMSIQYHGIYSFLYHSLAVHLMRMGYEYFNFEQDLGIIGLRKAKEQMNPVMFLKKFIIIPKEA